MTGKPSKPQEAGRLPRQTQRSSAWKVQVPHNIAPLWLQPHILEAPGPLLWASASPGPAALVLPACWGLLGLPALPPGSLLPEDSATKGPMTPREPLTAPAQRSCPCLARSGTVSTLTEPD